MYNISSNEFCCLKFSFGRVLFGLVTSPTRVTDYTPRSGKRDADGVLLKIDERKCLASRGWRGIRFLRDAHCHRAIMNIPPVPLPTPFRAFSSSTLSAVESGPPNIYVTAKTGALVRTPRAFALVFVSTRILEIFIPQITTKAGSALPKSSRCNAPRGTRLCPPNV